MPAATLPQPKRPLSDSTKAHRNANLPLASPNAAKRRKLEPPSPSKRLRLSQNGSKTGSSQPQPKSQFEEEVLEKLTQDISGLKQNNSEKDQQWDRPELGDFDPEKNNLCFQQIEAEEGTLHGGKTTIKLFGVTEVSTLHNSMLDRTNRPLDRLVTQFCFMSRTFYTTFTSLLLYHLANMIAHNSRPISSRSWRSISPPYRQSSLSCDRICSASKGIKTVHTSRSQSLILNSLIDYGPR